ncbi:Xaa-Pro peptidase family protein [Devosia sp.]|uniref:M24 family metallopeptidase n=1 Tax=Devosia sp. TaxID=1871048 RepID=UPI001B0F8237|nr:M24 family metallopeptidase [Devosia sp.]MBO9590694.1 aminopeptidase P family protein [Devosia sp.]
MNTRAPSPFDGAYHAQRIQQGRSLMEQKGLEAILLFSAPRGLAAGTRTSGNLGWFAGFSPIWAPSLLVLTADRATIIAPGKNEVRLFSTRVGAAFDVVGAGPDGIMATALELLGKCQWVGTAGTDELPPRFVAQLAAALPQAVALDAELQALRLTRAPIETELHRRASAISDAMIERAFAYAAEPGATPAGLMAEVEHEGRRHGADVSRLWLSTGPKPPVTYFEMFELPETLERGDRVQLGTMVSYEGYFAQGLRIGSIGPADPALADAIARIEAIQDDALALMRPGRPAHEMGDLIESRIDAICPYTRESDPFRFQSCHGLGLDYSEPGLAAALAPQRDRSRDDHGPVLQPGMVFEIHPNFSLPELGHVCAGDVALVTETGAEWLTRFPRGVFPIT